MINVVPSEHRGGADDAAGPEVHERVAVRLYHII